MSACERCWDQAFIESRRGPESQVEAYRRLLRENEGKAEWRGCVVTWPNTVPSDGDHPQAQQGESE